MKRKEIVMDVDRLDRIEEKLDHLLRMVESIALKQQEQSRSGFEPFIPDGQKQQALPARELRKWPEINFRGPRNGGRSR